MRETNQKRADLAKLFKGVGVEVGVERGIFSKMICSRNPETKLYGVDPWQAYREYRDHVSQNKLDNFREQALTRLMPYNWIEIRKFSVEAAKDFADESLDFVYLDANHDHDHVLEDLKAWYPKLKVGGIMAGHDYIKRKGQDHLYDVVGALQDFITDQELTIWRGDDSPSWSFIKL